MDSLNDLIGSVTEFMRFFAPGFIFISCLDFTICAKREDKIEYLVITCITISFILSTVTDLIMTISPTLNAQVCLVLLPAIAGVLVGKLRKAKWVNWLALRLFNHEFSNNLFVDLMEDVKASDASALCVRFTLKDDPKIYEGQLYKVLDIHTDPTLIFAYYVCYDSSGRVICDNTTINNSKLIIHYANVQSFEFIKAEEA